MIDRRFTNPLGYLRDEAASISDGVALTSAAHPRAPWYRRVWVWLRGSRLSPDSLEAVEIDTEDTGRRSDKVVDLPFHPKRPEMIWECRCGGQHFYLHNDGTIECRSCKLLNETIEWCVPRWARTEAIMTSPQCPHGHIYGTCLMCYHDLVAEQQSEIERLRRERNVFEIDVQRAERISAHLGDEINQLRAALKVAQQSLLEFSHAQESGPSWYTRGEQGMYSQVNLWLRRGLEAVQGALGPYDDNGQYLKEKPALPNIAGTASKSDERQERCPSREPWGGAQCRLYAGHKGDHLLNWLQLKSES